MIELSREHCRQVLDAGRVAHVACVSRGQPYVTPLSYVMLGDDFVFRTLPGRRIDSLEVDPRVCVEVTLLFDDDGEWQSVVFWGDARTVNDPAAKSAVVTAFLRKYQTPPLGGAGPPSLAGYRTVAITPEHMTGRASGEGLTPRLRPGRL